MALNRGKYGTKDGTLRTSEAEGGAKTAGQKETGSQGKSTVCQCALHCVCGRRRLYAFVVLRQLSSASGRDYQPDEKYCIIGDAARRTKEGK